MSSYENYSEASQCYDATRIPGGVEIIIGCLAQGEIPLGKQRLLDAGCGTGNYSMALLPQVGRISAVDLNEGMLARAREKLELECNRHNRERIDFHHASIDSLPFEDAIFDGIMVNQVLHHLELAADADYPVYRRVFAEFARVLKPGGAVVVNTCSHEQLRHGFWYYHLIPDETVCMCDRHAPLDVLRSVMQDIGITYQQCFVPLDAMMQGEAYFNPRGPLDKSWRDGDSMWSTVSDKTIDAVCTHLNQLERAKELENYFLKHDARRKHIGQFSFLYGRRKSSAKKLSADYAD